MNKDWHACVDVCMCVCDSFGLCVCGPSCREFTPLTRHTRHDTPLPHMQLWSAAVFLWWNFVEDKPVSVSCRETGLSEDAVRYIYKLCMLVLEEDVMESQRNVIFGLDAKPNMTVEVEADETCFSKWTVPSGDGGCTLRFFGGVSDGRAMVIKNVCETSHGR